MQDTAKPLVKPIKDAINKVSSTCGELGATQNRLERTNQVPGAFSGFFGKQFMV